jgi:tetratricopeptide (TPR) repeat protein
MEQAEREFSLALNGFRGLGDRWGMATAMDTLAVVASWRGDQDRSVALMDEALALMSQLGVFEDMSTLLQRRGDSRLRGGDGDGAHADYTRAAELARRAGAAEAIAGSYHGLGEVARLRGDLTEALRLYDIALSPDALTWAGEPRWRVLIGLGRVAQAQGDAQLARARHREALTHAVSTLNYLVAALAAEGLAGVAALEGDGERAALLLGLGVAFRGASIAGDPDVAQVTATGRSLVDAETYERAYARGSGATREEALALLDLPPLPEQPSLVDLGGGRS